MQTKRGHPSATMRARQGLSGGLLGTIKAEYTGFLGEALLEHWILGFPRLRFSSGFLCLRRGLAVAEAEVAVGAALFGEN